MLPSVNKINNLKEFLFEIRFFSLSPSLAQWIHSSSFPRPFRLLKKFSAMPDSVRQLSRFVRTSSTMVVKSGGSGWHCFFCVYFWVFLPGLADVVVVDSPEEKGRCIETAVEEQLVTLVTFGQVSGLLRRKGLNCL